MRVTVRVTPGSSRAEVGGEYGAADGPVTRGVLVVKVCERAVDGKATAAALRAVARAFGVSRGDVTLVSGASSRQKVLDVDAPDEQVTTRLIALLGREQRDQ